MTLPGRVCGLAALALALAAPAHAAPAAPEPAAPADGAAVAALPAFAWNPVAGADRYEFQIAADPGFNSPLLGAGFDRFFTRNTRATLKKTVPNGTLWWRVRAATKSGAVSPWSAARSLRKAWTIAPALEVPADGATVVFPAAPLRLSWAPVPGAAKYLVSLATDPRLGSLVTREPVETAATSFTGSAPLAPGTYYWGVTPIDAQGNRGAASRVSSFTWAWPSGTTTALADLVDALEVFDSHFSWDLVPGAARYEVEVNPSADFAPGSKVCCAGTTLGSSLSPTTLFENNTYYWRVRAVDPSGNAGVWNAGPSFTKTFDNVPPVTAPSIKNVHMRDHLNDPGTDVDGATAGYQTQVPVVTWDPVPGASSYQVNVTPFSAGACDWTAPMSRQWRVTTAATAWTPLGSGWAGVKPYPDPLSVSHDGATALLPNTSYCVRVRARSDRDAARNEIYGDYTYLNDGTGAAFTWTGYPAGGACSPVCDAGYLGAGDYVLPLTGTTTPRTPVFTWKPLGGKASYYVLVSKDPSFTTIADYAFTQVPAYAPRTATAPTTFSDETTLYYWAVLPATNANGSGAVGDPLAAAARSFQKQSVPPALLAPAADANVTGQLSFRWTPAEGARRYRLQVAQDPSFGNPIDNVTTNSTAYTSNSTYPADTRLYWRVRADDENLVGLTWSPTGTFQKRLPAPAPSASNPASGDLIPTWTWTPVTGATSYDVAVDEPDGDRKVWQVPTSAITAIKMTGTGVFTWRVRANFPKSPTGETPGPYSAPSSFTRTIREPAGAAAEVARDRLLFAWEPRMGVKDYRVQVSRTPDFSRVVETVTTDNTSYAPLLLDGQAYLEGGVFYWRVAAADEDANVGDFSPTQQFTLPRRMSLSAFGTPVRGRRVAVTIVARNALRAPVANARVRVSGAGVLPTTKRTNGLGRVTFFVRATKRGAVVFRATKAGYTAASVTRRAG